jgi:hypothetical protein
MKRRSQLSTILCVLFARGFQSFLLSNLDFVFVLSMSTSTPRVLDSVTGTQGQKKVRLQVLGSNSSFPLHFTVKQTSSR